MTLRFILLLALFPAGCFSPRNGPPSGESERRDYWRERVVGIFACRDYRQIDSFLDGIGARPTRRPRQLGGGSYQIANQPLVSDDLYALDDLFDLYVVWNGPDQAQGIRSVEVVGFVDLRPRIAPDLFELAQAVHRSPSAVVSWSYDPVLVIRAVNTLQNSGDRACPALKAYLDLERQLSFEDARKHAIDRNRVFPIVQLLSTHPHRFGLGLGDVADPGSSSWPLFPMTLEADVPFMVLTGYVLAGAPEDPAGRLEKGFALRDLPLAPTENPIDAVERLTSSPRWEELLRSSDPWTPKPTERGARQLRMKLRNQALEAIAPVYRPPDEYFPKSCCEDPQESAWREVVQQVRALGIRWDAGRQDFVRSH